MSDAERTTGEAEANHRNHVGLHGKCSLCRSRVQVESGGSGAGSTVESEDERIDNWLEAWGNCTDEQLKAVSRLRADLAQARARIEALETASRALLASTQWCGASAYVNHSAERRLVRDALDAAQAAQQPQHACETTPALGDLQWRGPRQDAAEH